MIFVHDSVCRILRADLVNASVDKRVAQAREELRAVVEGSRKEELDMLHRVHRPAKQHTLLLRWLLGWLTPTKRAVAEPLPKVQKDQVGISFAGHATALLQYERCNILCDPILAKRLGIVRRAVLPGFSPAELDHVDLILITHSHHDHLHLPTLRKLPKSSRIVVPQNCAQLIQKLHFEEVIELGIGESLTHQDCEITATQVQHDTHNGRNSCAYFIRGSGPTVFFCGDSGYFDGFAELGAKYQIDIALLPIGGYVGPSFRSRHMSPLDALYAFEDLRARMFVPIHHSSFALSYEELHEPTTWLRELVQKLNIENYVTILEAGASKKFFNFIDAENSSDTSSSHSTTA